MLCQKKTQGFILAAHSDGTGVMSGSYLLETRNQLFFQCAHLQTCIGNTFALLGDCHLNIWVTPAKDFIVRLKQAIAHPFSLEIIIRTGWAILTTRNDNIL
jgi:hypothetical protein